MSDIFAGSQFIELELFYTIQKNKHGTASVTIVPPEQAHKMLADEKTKESVKCLRTKWLQQSWRAAHDLVTASMEYNHTNDRMKFNPHLYRDAKLKACLQDWDAKDADGSVIGCNEMTINNLHWQIAAALIDLYEEATEPTQDDATKN